MREEKEAFKGDVIYSPTDLLPKKLQNVDMPYSCIREESLSDSFCLTEQ